MGMSIKVMGFGGRQLTSSCFCEMTGHFTRRTYSATMVSTHAIKSEYCPLDPLTVVSATSSTRMFAWWNMYGSFRRLRRCRTLAFFSRVSRSLKSPLPEENFCHSKTVQAGRSHCKDC
jgi:hypothetical protein